MKLNRGESMPKRMQRQDGKCMLDVHKGLPGLFPAIGCVWLQWKISLSREGYNKDGL